MHYPPESPLLEGAWLRSGADHHCLVLFSLRRPAARAPGLTVGLHHFGFEVGGLADILAAHRALAARGVPAEARIGGPGWQVRLYFHDPDGNQVELYWDMDQIGWEGRSRPYAPVEVIDLESFDLDAYLTFKADHSHT